jgi:hypothetical protein
MNESGGLVEPGKGYVDESPYTKREKIIIHAPRGSDIAHSPFGFVVISPPIHTGTVSADGGYVYTWTQVIVHGGRHIEVRWHDGPDCWMED